MTTIFTTRRIEHLIADGKVTVHVVPAPRVHTGPLPWMPSHSYPVRCGRGAARCRVVVNRIRHQALDELTPRDLYDSGHRTRLELARWWMRREIRNAVRRGDEWDDAEILRRFAPLAKLDVWRIDFARDLEHAPRLLHADPSQGYTTLPQLAAPGEPEALSARDLERVVNAAHARPTNQGHQEQQARGDLDSLESRLSRIRARSRRGVDVRSELRIIERQVQRAEGKIARARDA